MIKICISVTSHALDPLPLSQTVIPSRTPSPSSVTYFMDGPKFHEIYETSKIETFFTYFYNDLLWLNSIGRYMYVLPRKCSAMAQSRISAYVGPLARNYLPKSWSGIASPLTSSVLSSGDALGFSYLVDPGTWPIQITFIILHMHYNLRCMVQPNLLVTIS